MVNLSVDYEYSYSYSYVPKLQKRTIFCLDKIAQSSTPQNFLFNPLGEELIVSEVRYGTVQVRYGLVIGI